MEKSDQFELCRSQRGNVSLPKFKLEYDTKQKRILSASGIQRLFSSTQADFSAMTDTPVAIDTVRHKAVIEVNEEGTEAAGVTSYWYPYHFSNAQRATI